MCSSTSSWTIWSNCSASANSTLPFAPPSGPAKIANTIASGVAGSRVGWIICGSSGGNGGYNTSLTAQSWSGSGGACVGFFSGGSGGSMAGVDVQGGGGGGSIFAVGGNEAVFPNNATAGTYGSGGGGGSQHNGGAGGAGRVIIEY